MLTRQRRSFLLSRIYPPLVFALLSISVSLTATSSADAAVFTVNTLDDTEDAMPGDGLALDGASNTSLRAAISEANALAGADQILFDVSLTSAGDATITLSLFDTGLDSGEYGPTAFFITSEISITGPSGDDGISIERDSTNNNEFRLFHITSAGTLNLAQLNLSGGIAQGGHGGSGNGAGGGGAAGIGGAILNEGTLTLSASTLSTNQALGGSGRRGGSSFAGGGGGGGSGADGANGSDPNGGAGGNPNGGASNSGAGGNGGGGGGGLHRSGAGDQTAGPGGPGGLFGGGGAGGMSNATGGGGDAIAGDGGNGGFGGGGGGGGRARSGAASQTRGEAGLGGFGGGDALAGTNGDSGEGGDGGGGAGFGGAIYNLAGTITIENSTLSGNTAAGGGSGGAPDDFGDVEPLADAFGGAGYGAALFSTNGLVQVFHSTFAENTVVGGGSALAQRFGDADGTIYSLGNGAQDEVQLNNTIVANTNGGIDFVANTISAGSHLSSGSGNLIETQSGFGGTIASSADPQLGSLANNRGPTLTHALNEGSPAIDNGDDGATTAVLTDQRGGIFIRTADGNLDGTAQVDIGAYEEVLIDYGDAADFISGAGPTSIVLEQGADDFRISVAGDDGETDPNIRDNFRADDARVAYNATNNEFFVIWFGDDDTGTTVDNENEVFGQRLNASSGALIGTPIRISQNGPDGDANFDANDASVAWDSTNNRYLVVWDGDDNTPPLVDNEFEILGRILNADGSAFSAPFRISVMGDDGETDPTLRDDFRADNPDVTYNATADEFVVVWRGDTGEAPTVDNEEEVYARRISSSASLLGSQTRVSFMGNEAEADPAVRNQIDANDPRLTWNSQNNEYLVVWAADDDTGTLVNNEIEIYGQRLDASLGLQGARVRISTIGVDGDTTLGSLTFNTPPAPAYNVNDNEYLVTWPADATIDNDFEIYGQRLNAANGSLLGGEISISEMGGPNNADFDATVTDAAFNPSTNAYLVIWQGDEVLDNKNDIYVRRVSNTGVVLDSDDIPISNMGPGDSTAFGAFTPSLAYSSADQHFLLAWEADDDTPPLVDGEVEIHGQLVSDAAIVDYNSRGSNNGPAHFIANGLFIGDKVDSESDAQAGLSLDGDDLLNNDDEDGISGPLQYSIGAPAINVLVTNTSGVSATLYGWIDYNADGIFDNASERASIAVPSPSVGATVTLTFPAVPLNAASSTVARLRLSSDPAAADPTGLVTGGEVEDHRAESNLDSTPNAFAFTDQNDVALNQLILSNIITVTGINVPSPIEITNGEYSINGQAFTSAVGNVDLGDEVQVRHTSSSNFLTAVDTVLDIGTVSDTFTSTTVDEDTRPDAFNFTDQTDVMVSTLIISDSISVSGINSSTAIGVVNGEYEINNSGVFTNTPGSVNAGDNIRVRHLSAASFLTTVDTQLDIGGISDTFSSTTEAADAVPDAFSFSDQSDVALNALIVSNSITLSGTNTAAPISVTNGEYELNNSGVFTSTAGMIGPGDSVRVRHTSASTIVTVTDTILDINGISDTFTSTTLDSDVDLAISKDFLSPGAEIGDSARFSIVVSNIGLEAVNGANVSDNLPSALNNASWSCVASGGGSCSSSGNGDINDTVNLPIGAQVSYTLTTTIASGAPQSFVNSADVSVPAGQVDRDISNNSASATVVLSRILEDSFEDLLLLLEGPLSTTEVQQQTQSAAENPALASLTHPKFCVVELINAADDNTEVFSSRRWKIDGRGGWQAGRWQIGLDLSVLCPNS